MPDEVLLVIIEEDIEDVVVLVLIVLEPVLPVELVVIVVVMVDFDDMVDIDDIDEVIELDLARRPSGNFWPRRPHSPLWTDAANRRKNKPKERMVFGVGDFDPG